MRILSVVNTSSGGGDAGLYDVVRIAGLKGAETVMRFVTPGTSIEELVKDVETFDRVIVSGGDGTASAVCYATRDTGVPVLVLSAGTANLLALNLGLPTDAVALASLLLNGTAARFDLGELEARRLNGDCVRSGFTIMAGAGYDAQIMESASPLKSTFGATAYLIAAIGNMAPTPARFRLVLDGREVITDGIAVLLVNFGRIQFDLDITREWDPRDGLLDVVVARTKNAAGLLPVLLGAMMEKVGDGIGRGQGIESFKARTIEISSEPPLKIQYDGEATELQTPLTARVLPQAATLLVAPDSPYAGPR
jgi:diacylglycerol kinase family enzyme